MKTIVSLALAGLMSISALLPALAAQEAENVSIPENSGISESVAQDESSVSSSCSTADESTEPESGSNAGADVSPPESDSMPVESDSSISEDSEAETSSSLPVSESTVSDETESVPDSETTESDANAEDLSGVTAATADEQTVPVTVSKEYAILLATNQADSMMGHAGMERSDACTQPAASFALADYAAKTEDESYCLLWEAMNAAFEQLGAQGYSAARCAYADGTLMVYV
ncbi:MAG: hypothetical protein ACLTV4_04395 [Ruthenibacterium lactatiformans]